MLPLWADGSTNVCSGRIALLSSGCHELGGGPSHMASKFIVSVLYGLPCFLPHARHEASHPELLGERILVGGRITVGADP